MGARKKRLFLLPAGGLLLAAGPVCSGKSTSLYCALSKLDTIGSNVLTLEDPIEFSLERVNQIQVS